jgi:hypothetical protein
VIKLRIAVTALTLAAAFSGSATAQIMSKADYGSARKKIEVDYHAAKVGCNSLAGNANDVCAAAASGHQKIAMADLDAMYRPSRSTHYRTRVARAEAQFSVARERCDVEVGNNKSVCVKEAVAAEAVAKADATVQMKTANANAVAKEISTDARTKANSQSYAARKNAAVEKLAADYEFAKQKCAAFEGSAKDQCLDLAKQDYDKP